MTWALLVSLLAKSSLVAGAGLVCARRLTRDPVERVDILRGAVCLLLALPLNLPQVVDREGRPEQRWVPDPEDGAGPEGVRHFRRPKQVSN